jgi:hypothetical protein
MQSAAGLVGLRACHARGASCGVRPPRSGASRAYDPARGICGAPDDTVVQQHIRISPQRHREGLCHCIRAVVSLSAVDNAPHLTHRTSASIPRTSGDTAFQAGLPVAHSLE